MGTFKLKSQRNLFNFVQQEDSLFGLPGQGSNRSLNRFFYNYTDKVTITKE